MSRLFRKIWNWFLDHKIVAIMVVANVILIIFGVFIFSKVDPYQRLVMLAGFIPHIIMSEISAFIFVCFYLYFFRSGGFSKMQVGSIKGEKPDVKWDDVIGMEDAKQEAMEVVNLIKDRARLRSMGGQVLHGLLMMGPPGCGKTYLAKAIATETNLPFLPLTGSEFVEVFVGVGASRMRQLFKTARRLADEHGGCIIFIDEIDSIAAQRTFNFSGGSEMSSTQNQLLAEMDGLKTSDRQNILVIGATNAPESTLDPALLRPGRFDRKIHVSLPNLQEREMLFEFYINKVKHDDTINIPRLARRAVYKSPADIANIVKEATLIAIRNNKDAIGWKEISEAMERVDLGIKHRKHLSPQEKERIAYHESGHLVVMFLLHPTDDVFKASIIARRDFLGVVYHQPKEEIFTSDENRYKANIKVALAGYVAEKLRFGSTSDGISADFKKASELAYTMVWRLGMNRLGIVGDLTAVPKELLSKETVAALDKEAQTILNECKQDVIALLEQERHILDRFAQELITKEELEYDEIERIFAEYGKTNPRFSIE